MGIIDKLCFKFKCPKCGGSETVSVPDKGSSFGGSSWGSVGHQAALFTITSTGGGKEEPGVTGAVCVACQVPAEVESKYGFGRPKDF